MINVFIDIETLPDQSEGAKDSIEVKAPAQYKKQESINKWIADNGDQYKDEQWRKTSFNGAKGQICVIGVSVETSDGYSSNGAFSALEMTEGQMLNAFWSWLGKLVKSHQWRFVAHNAKFDLPFLFHRSVINQVKPLRYNPHGRHGQHHYCTMESWAGFGQRISMDNLASALGIEGKGDMDGSKVYDNWLEDPQRVIYYCLDDVRMLEQIYNRLEFVG